MRRDLAPSPDHGVLLDLDERADLRVGPHRAAIQVDQCGMEDLDVAGQDDGIGDGGRTASSGWNRPPRLRRDPTL
jgi:hypothetical protein